MKKSDAVSIIVYIIMLVIAVIVGLTSVQPLNETVSGELAIPFVGVVVIALVIAVIVAAALIELGHLWGAKIGGYEVVGFSILGLGAKKDKEGKWHFVFGKFDGLCGGTEIVPKDREKSSARAYTTIPLLFLLLFIIAMAVCMIFSGGSDDPNIPWLYVSSLIALTVAGLILLYDIFPMELDCANDGYRYVLISNPKNKVPFNDSLIATRCTALGEPLPEMEPYQELTDFTFTINSAILYSALREGDRKKAVGICEIAIKNKEGIAKNNYGEAVAMKLSLLLLVGDKAEAKAYFDSLGTEEKKYIASMPSMAALRSYLLVSAVLDGSESETEVAMARRVSLIKKVDPSIKDVEKALYKESLAKAKALYPDWGIFAARGEVIAHEDEAPAEEKPAETEDKPEETKGE